MFPRLRLILFFVLVCVVFFDAGAFVVYVPIPQLRFLVDQVVGDRLHTRSVILTSGDVDNFTVGENVLNRIRKADLYFYADLPFEKAYKTALYHEYGKGVNVVDVTNGFPYLVKPEGIAYKFWYSVESTDFIIYNILNALILQDNANQSRYINNTEKLIDRIRKLKDYFLEGVDKNYAYLTYESIPYIGEEFKIEELFIKRH